MTRLLPEWPEDRKARPMSEHDAYAQLLAAARVAASQHDRAGRDATAELIRRLVATIEAMSVLLDEGDDQ